MVYLLDTNIPITLSRHPVFSNFLRKKYGCNLNEDSVFLSIITLGEINAIIKKQSLGDRRIDVLKRVTATTTILPINKDQIIAAYGTLDAYSQGKLDPVDFTSRNMGKNDPWIAATAAVSDLPLITTDKDFDHLQGSYLDVRYVDLNEFTP